MTVLSSIALLVGDHSSVIHIVYEKSHFGVFVFCPAKNIHFNAYYDLSDNLRTPIPIVSFVLMSNRYGAEYDADNSFVNAVAELKSIGIMRVVPQDDDVNETAVITYYKTD